MPQDMNRVVDSVEQGMAEIGYEPSPPGSYPGFWTPDSWQDGDDRRGDDPASGVRLAGPRPRPEPALA